MPAWQNLTCGDENIIEWEQSSNKEPYIILGNCNWQSVEKSHKYNLCNDCSFVGNNDLGKFLLWMSLIFMWNITCKGPCPIKWVNKLFHIYSIYQSIMATKTGNSWWRHQMETFSALLALCAGKPPVTGEFPSQRPVTRSFDVFFDLRLNKRLSKQSWGCDLRRHHVHYDVTVMYLKIWGNSELNAGWAFNLYL